MTSAPEPFLSFIAPYRTDLIIGVECIFTWYWLADLCAHEQIDFILSHALYMKAIHGGKAKNDRIDTQKIAMLMRSGMFPEAYVYPAAMRATLAPFYSAIYKLHQCLVKKYGKGKALSIIAAKIG